MLQNRPSTTAAYALELAVIVLPEDFPFVGGTRFVQGDNPIRHLHAHQALEIGYCHEGSGIFVIEDKVLPYRTGCASIIREREMHLAQSTPGTTSTWTFLSVDPGRLLAGMTDNATFITCTDLHGRGFPNILAPESETELCRLIALLVAEAASPTGSGHRELVRGLMLAIMARLHRLPGRSDAGTAGRSAALRRLAPALGYLGSHFRDELSIPVLAAVCGLSPTHFRRLFTAAFGQAPLDYIVRFRLEKAAALLRDGRTPVLTVALDCGFNSLSAFQRHFRRVFACTPREWRRHD